MKTSIITAVTILIVSSTVTPSFGYDSQKYAQNTKNSVKSYRLPASQMKKRKMSSPLKRSVSIALKQRGQRTASPPDWGNVDYICGDEWVAICDTIECNHGTVHCEDGTDIPF